MAAYLQMDEEELVRRIRTKTDLDNMKKEIRKEVNFRVHGKMLERIQEACYTPCMGGHFEEDLTKEQTECLDHCSNNFRMVQFVVSECSLAWEKDALAKSEQSRAAATGSRFT